MFAGRREAHNHGLRGAARCGRPGGIPARSGALRKLVIADDHQLMREGLRALIERSLSDDVRVVAEAATLSDAEQAVRAHRPDLLVLDLKMYLDAENPRDEVRITGDPAVHSVVQGGIHGDRATVAALVNTAARVLQAPAGMLLMTDLSAARVS